MALKSDSAQPILNDAFNDMEKTPPTYQSTPPFLREFGLHLAVKKNSTCQKQYKIEKVLDFETRSNGIYYLIKWVGFSTSQNSWEPAENLSKDCQPLINELMEQKRQEVYQADSSRKALRAVQKANLQSFLKMTKESRLRANAERDLRAIKRSKK